MSDEAESEKVPLLVAASNNGQSSRSGRRGEEKGTHREGERESSGERVIQQ